MARPLSALYGQDYFNANRLSPPRVGELFSFHPSLLSLAGLENSILTGPRGSGKTTLMKMQLREALDSWSDERAAELLQMEAFSIYFGPDTLTNSEIDASLAAGDDVDDSGRVRRAIEKCQDERTLLQLFRVVLRGVKYEVSVGRARPNRSGSKRAIGTLSEVLGLLLPVLTWEELVRAIQLRVAVLSNALAPVTVAATPDEAVVASESSRAPLLTDFLSLVHEETCVAFDDLPRHWIWLFDEVEMLSRTVQTQILGLIRRLPTQFSMKVALTPWSTTREFVDELNGVPGQDFRPVSLNPGSSQEIIQSTLNIANNLLTRLGHEGVDPYRLFGGSAFSSSRVEHRVPSGSNYRLSDSAMVEELAAASVRFRDYARSKEFSTEYDRLKQSPSARSAGIRKARPIAQLWLERLVAPGSRQSVRSLKVPRVYCGHPTFLSMTDSNPRSVLRVLDECLDRTPEWRSELDKASTGSTSSKAVFSRNTQTAVLDNEVLHHVSLGMTYLARHSALSTGSTAMGLLESIGLQFQTQVYDLGEFRPEPVTTFTVDDAVADDVVAALADALHCGLLVEVRSGEVSGRGPSTTSASDSGVSLRGRQFRLSYLFGSRYWLPPRVGRPMNLSTLLSATFGFDALEQVDDD